MVSQEFKTHGGWCGASDYKFLFFLSFTLCLRPTKAFNVVPLINVFYWSFSF